MIGLRLARVLFLTIFYDLKYLEFTYNLTYKDNKSKEASPPRSQLNDCEGDGRFYNMEFTHSIERN